MGAVICGCSNLGFDVTCAVSYEHPYTLARRFSTLDHLTGWRIGWNVVTGYLNSAAKGIGLARQPEHDTRYEIAEEYMQIVYKLWEGSWEDEAVLRDRARRVFARPQKVHRIRHDGRYFQIEAIHLCEPSPQRTPLIYQAGASSSLSAASTLNVTDAAAAGVRGPEGSGESEPRGQRSTVEPEPSGQSLVVDHEPRYSKGGNLTAVIAPASTAR